MVSSHTPPSHTVWYQGWDWSLLSKRFPCEPLPCNFPYSPTLHNLTNWKMDLCTHINIKSFRCSCFGTCQVSSRSSWHTSYSGVTTSLSRSAKSSVKVDLPIFSLTQMSKAPGSPTLLHLKLWRWIGWRVAHCHSISSCHSRANAGPCKSSSKLLILGLRVYCIWVKPHHPVIPSMLSKWGNISSLPWENGLRDLSLQLKALQGSVGLKIVFKLQTVVPQLG